MNDPTDTELLAAIARGQHEALGVLYDRHAAVLFTLSLHVAGGDRERAEDLVHDVFLDLARAARRRDPKLDERSEEMGGGDPAGSARGAGARPPVA